MKKTILLLEDNLEMRENTAEIIELANYNVLTASNGRDGVDIAKEHIPDLIVCDIMMPEMDGYEVLAVLSNDPKTSTIPFVFLTAKAEKSEFRKGMNMGADDYITKPFEEIELLTAIKSRIERSERLKLSYENNLKGISDFLDDAKGIDKLDKLAENKRIRHYKKKEIIYYEGDFANAIYFINSGRVRTYKINDDAKEYSVALNGPGDFIGYLSILEGDRYMESAETMDDIEILKIQKEEFTDLLFSNREVSNRFIKMLTHNIIEKEEKLLNLAYNSVRKRVADSLIELEKKYKGESTEDFVMAITRNELASLVGTSTETVIRTLSDFKDEKLIEIKGSKIKILKSFELENLRN